MLLDSERDSEKLTCMPEELEVAVEVEIEETNSVVTEEDRGGQEEMTATRKEEIKWRYRRFTTIMDISFENPPIHEDHPMRPCEYFKQFVPKINSGMAYDFLLHQGTAMELPQEHRKQLGLGAAVVYHFTTYNLLELLAKRRIHAAGTARVSCFARPPLQ